MMVRIKIEGHIGSFGFKGTNRQRISMAVSPKGQTSSDNYKEYAKRKSTEIHSQGQSKAVD